jgi:hypothetical protein
MKSFSTDKKVVPSINPNYINSSMRKFNPDNTNIDSKREFHYSMNKIRNQMNLNPNTTNFNNFNNNNIINGNVTNTYGSVVNNVNNNININNNINVNNNNNGNSNLFNSQINFYNTPNLLQNNPKNAVTTNRFRSTNSSQGFK